MRLLFVTELLAQPPSSGLCRDVFRPFFPMPSPCPPGTGPHSDLGCCTPGHPRFPNPPLVPAPGRGMGRHLHTDARLPQRHWHPLERAATPQRRRLGEALGGNQLGADSGGREPVQGVDAYLVQLGQLGKGGSGPPTALQVTGWHGEVLRHEFFGCCDGFPKHPLS